MLLFLQICTFVAASVARIGYMDKEYLHNLLDRVISGASLSRDDWRRLLSDGAAPDVAGLLRNEASRIATGNFGKGVFVRGLIEISSYCRNNCNYCGLRCSNREALRYRLTKEEILDCCCEGAALGFNTFVLQGGEDVKQGDEWIVDVVRSIKAMFPDKAVTLSVGERSVEGYRAMRQAGADRYLLRHETRSDEHYALLHPSAMSAEKRRASLQTLKSLGFQTGSGMMIGSPYQTLENIVDDLMYLDELKPQMIGIGPFIPARNTPFAQFPAGSVDLTILIVSLLRLRFPKALIPATTALASIDEQGRERAILAGANVVMPNLSPLGVRSKYSIYDGKKSLDSESAQALDELARRLATICYHIDFGRGDYNEK